MSLKIANDNMAAQIKPTNIFNDNKLLNYQILY